MTRFWMILNLLIAVFDLTLFVMDPSHWWLLGFAALALFCVWVLHRSERADREAERKIQRYLDTSAKIADYEAARAKIAKVRPRAGWLRRPDGTQIPIRFVPTEDPAVFLAVTINGEPVPPDSGEIEVDMIGPGQAVAFRRKP